MTIEIYSLIKNEGWEVRTDVSAENGIEFSLGKEYILAYGERFPLTHPINIHFKLYRTLDNPERKYFHMKAIHDYLWPSEIPAWNYWSERRFRAHCSGRNYIALASGANTGKSYDVAKIALIFYLANPENRAVIVASTTLAGLDSRIWGYAKTLFKKIKIDLPIGYTSSPNPKFLYDYKKAGKKEPNTNIKDTIHGMFAIAAKKGDDDDAISGWIGRHPEDKLLLVLDEATDMPLSILKALPNLEAKPEKFQLIAIGNSLSKYDLHGTMCTPKAGWNSLKPTEIFEWETTQRNGICLYFYPFDSPAIHETDPVKAKVLSGFLYTMEELDNKKRDQGEKSEAYYRFTLGLWRSTSGGETVVDPGDVIKYKMQDLAEWSGVYPLYTPWGLDPSFSTRGDDCVLRLAYLGVDVRGKVILDFRRDKLLFKIPILANGVSVPTQIVDNVASVLLENQCNLGAGAIDSNGSGFGLGDSLRLKMGGSALPRKLITSRLGGNLKENDKEGTVVRTAYQLWYAFNEFIENDQIRGLDDEAIIQLTHRRVLMNDKNQPKLEDKIEYKRRMGNIIKGMGRSPDHADAASMVLQSAMLNFGFFPGETRTLENSHAIEKMYYAQQATMQQQMYNVPMVAQKQFNLKATFSAPVESLASRKRSPFS